MEESLNRFKNEKTVRLCTPSTRDFAKPNTKFILFADGETKYYLPKIEKNSDKKAIDQYDGKEVFIFDRLWPEPQRKFFTLTNVITDLSWHTNKICLIIPYFPFLRQDHDSSGTDPYETHEGKTALLSLRHLGMLGISRLIILDGHCFKGEGIYTTDAAFRKFPKQQNKKTNIIEEIKEFEIISPNLKIINLSMREELKRKVLFLAKQKGYKKILFISPDSGASYMGQRNLNKKRGTNENDGVVEVTEISSNIKKEELEEFDAICFVDDMVASGGTNMDAITYLRTEIGVKLLPFTNIFENIPQKVVDLFCAVTHWQGLGDASANLSSVGISSKRLVVSNSIIHNNLPLVSGNAVRVQEKLEKAASLITFDDKKDVEEIRAFLKGPN
ncbi:hypothetical protein KO317_02975 [Candidatus Micrarchaeota archaeon]|nr:hypothetical protein [Candidatus Micrarchaeota archaeon]